MMTKKDKPTNGGIIHRGGGRWVMLCGQKEIELGRGYINPAGDYLMSDDQQDAISPASFAKLNGRDPETPEIQPETGGTAEPVQNDPAPANVEPDKCQLKQWANLSRAERIKRARAQRTKRQETADQPGTGWDWAQSL